ncbi:MAG: hypothetical protein Kow0068_24580 [Marinilabiliales bacterium]
MKKLLLLLVFPLIIVNYGFDSGDYELISKDGKFKINFPGKPELSSQMVDLGETYGEIEMFMYMYSASASEVYMVAYADYPDAVFEDISKELILTSTTDGFYGSYGEAKYKKNKKITLDGHPGLTTQASIGGSYFFYDVYIVNNRLFQVAIVNEGKYTNKKDAQAFMGSFALN